MSNLVEVGDIIVHESFMGRTEFLITRVTKKLALSKREKDGYEHRFIRFISSDMNYPKSSHSSVKFSVIRREDKE